MIWWIGQNLDQPIVGPDGTTWHFLVGHASDGGEYVQRVFFWDENRTTTGLAEWRGSQTLHVRRIKDRLRRIANDEEYRSRFLRQLRFPVERHW
jgi:hypothetical protein